MHVAFVAEEGYNDDVITINTQLSTQIDGLRHFPYSLNGSTSTYQQVKNMHLSISANVHFRFYNELVTFQDIMSAEGITTLGIHSKCSSFLTLRQCNRTIRHRTEGSRRTWRPPRLGRVDGFQKCTLQPVPCAIFSACLQPYFER